MKTLQEQLTTNPKVDDKVGNQRSPLGYLGGKSRLAKLITQFIPKHTCYVEPFCGASWVYFTKEPSTNEVLNDLDGQLVTFWRVIRNHLPEFLRCLRYSVVSRQEFEAEAKLPTVLMTDVQKAVRYYKLQKMGFGGKTVNRTFGTSCVRPSALNINNAPAILKDVHRRMARTTLENLDACVCIEKYDSEKTFFYIDPPYWDADFYAVSFSKPDFLRLKNKLSSIKGKFILSLNDTPEIRAIFSEFQIENVTTKYSLANPKVSKGTRDKERKEVLIHNLGVNLLDGRTA